MSYILDALRKSEEARRRQQGPDLSLAEPAAQGGRTPTSKAMPLLALALLIHGAVFGFWLLRPAQPEPASSGEPSAPDAVEVVIATPAPQAPAPTPRPLRPEPLREPTASPIRTAWQQQPVRRLSELSAQSRNRFPRLTISTHIFADEADFREVSINGRRYQEGDSVAGLTLLAITETGVLLAFEDGVIRLDLQDEWAL